jgi:dihydrofolate synthase/folylpolyglutamate synthase
MPAAQLAVIATEIFGEERVQVEPRLPDAIEAAVTLAEADLDAELSGAGVVITGSVFTVADARGLLKR